MEKSTYFMLIAVIFATLFLSMVSANYVVVGTVYDGNPNNPKTNEPVTIICDAQTLTTTSLNDGTYAVVFGVDSCGIVTATNPDYDVSIIKMYVDPSANPVSNSGGGGSSHRYYLCGNGLCDSGETTNTCPKDCKITTLSSNETEEFELLEEDNQETETGVSTLTGAVIADFITSGQGIAILAILLAVIASGIILFRIRKK